VRLQNEKANINQTVVVPFSFYIRLTPSSSATVLSAVVNPTQTPFTTSSRLGAIASTFESFRFKRLDITTLPNSSLVDVVVGYSPETFAATAPSTASETSEMADSSVNGAVQTVPTHLVCNVQKKGAYNWYKVPLGTSDLEEVSQGSLLITTSSSTSGTYGFLISGVCLFKDPKYTGASLQVPARIPEYDACNVPTAAYELSQQNHDASPSRELDSKDDESVLVCSLTSDQLEEAASIFDRFGFIPVAKDLKKPGPPSDAGSSVPPVRAARRLEVAKARDQQQPPNGKG
jgi:hypothetical protein